MVRWIRLRAVGWCGTPPQACTLGARTRRLTGWQAEVNAAVGRKGIADAVTSLHAKMLLASAF
jgi:hypothetical protein